MKKTESYFITVIEDCDSGRVVATASLFTEYKFIHSTALVSPLVDPFDIVTKHSPFSSELA